MDDGLSDLQFCKRLSVFADSPSIHISETQLTLTSRRTVFNEPATE
jgi:hypothetical protein